MNVANLTIQPDIYNHFTEPVALAESWLLVMLPDEAADWRAHLDYTDRVDIMAPQPRTHIVAVREKTRLIEYLRYGALFAAGFRPGEIGCEAFPIEPSFWAGPLEPDFENNSLMNGPAAVAVGVTVSSQPHVPAQKKIEGDKTNHDAASGKVDPRSLTELDAGLVEEMRQLIKSGKAKSVNDAANSLSIEAAGGGTLDSKRRRLARRYREQIGSGR